MPLDVHMAKFLIFASLFQCLDAALTIAVNLCIISTVTFTDSHYLIKAALNSKSPFVSPFGRESEADAAKQGFNQHNSDFLAIYEAYKGWRKACAAGRWKDYCRKNFLSHQV
jgi:ATP-dependent RNA helicase DHX29